MPRLLPTPPPPQVPPAVDPSLQALSLMACSFDPGLRPAFSFITAELEPVIQKMKQVGAER